MVLLDDFEDQSLSEYSGSTGSYAIQSSVVAADSYALEGASTSNWAAEMMHRGDVVTSQGDTIELDVYLQASDGALNFHFGWQGDDATSPSCYVIYIYTTEFSIARYDSGTWTYLTQTNPTLPENEWLHITIDWATNGDITVTADDSSGSQVGSASATDETYLDGGIGWDAYANTWYADEVFTNGDKSAPGGGGGTEDPGTGTTLIDDFEGGLTDWTVSGASTSTFYAYSGTTSVDLSSRSDYIRQATPSVAFDQGDRATFYFRPEFSTSTISFRYAWADSSNYYEATVEDGSLTLSKVEGGTSTTLGTGSFSQSAGTWYEVRVDWENTADHTLTVLSTDGTQLGTASGSDATWETGGYEFSNGYFSYVDYVTKTDLSNPITVGSTAATGAGTSPAASSLRSGSTAATGAAGAAQGTLASTQRVGGALAGPATGATTASAATSLRSGTTATTGATGSGDSGAASIWGTVTVAGSPAPGAGVGVPASTDGAFVTSTTEPSGAGTSTTAASLRSGTEDAIEAVGVATGTAATTQRHLVVSSGSVTGAATTTPATTRRETTHASTPAMGASAPTVATTTGRGTLPATAATGTGSAPTAAVQNLRVTGTAIASGAATVSAATRTGTVTRATEGATGAATVSTATRTGTLTVPVTPAVGGGLGVLGGAESSSGAMTNDPSGVGSAPTASVRLWMQRATAESAGAGVVPETTILAHKELGTVEPSGAASAPTARVKYGMTVETAIALGVATPEDVRVWVGPYKRGLRSSRSTGRTSATRRNASGRTTTRSDTQSDGHTDTS